MKIVTLAPLTITLTIKQVRCLLFANKLLELRAREARKDHKLILFSLAKSIFPIYIKLKGFQREQASHFLYSWNGATQGWLV